MLEFTLKPARRRFYYLMLHSEQKEAEVFLQAVMRGLNGRLPSCVFFEVDGTLARVGIRILPGVADNGRYVLQLLADWSAGRRYALFGKIGEMEKYWPELKDLIVSAKNQRRGLSVSYVWARFRKWLLG